MRTTIKTMKQSNRALFVLTIAIGFLLTSCGEAPYYEKVVSFKNNKWGVNEKPTFNVEIDDTSALYDFVLTLRTTTEYKYNNLWIFWNTKTPTGENVREPFELKITAPDGSWLGKNSGTIVENQIHFRQRKIAPKGTYTFVLEQGITEEYIDNVLDVDLKVEKVK